MALVFGSGEPVARLRRGLDIKGRVVLGLDEIVVPTVLVGDLTIPPIRRSPVRWWSSRNVPAVAANQGRYRIFHQLEVDQLVDQIWLSPTTSAMTFVVGHGPSGVVAGALAARTTEIVDPQGAVISRALGIFAFVDAITPASIGTPLWRGRIAGDDLKLLPLEIVIPAMTPTGLGTSAPTLTIEGGATNVAYDITVSGLYYDALPVTHKT